MSPATSGQRVSGQGERTPDHPTCSKRHDPLDKAEAEAEAEEGGAEGETPPGSAPSVGSTPAEARLLAKLAAMNK